MHILQITNHGLHEWEITPGLPDTGGQNIYVNQMSAALTRLGHQVTIVNRGGYPHPLSGESRTGKVPGLGGNGQIVYLSDGRREFIRKEDMRERLPALADELWQLMDEESFDLIISHYWDGGLLGVMANQNRPDPLPHIWIPHSLGALKKTNVDPEEWVKLRIDERIKDEIELVKMVDGVAATSVAIRNTLRTHYDHDSAYFLPPGIDHERYRPRPREECSSIYDHLGAVMGRTPAEIERRPLVVEVSRTDTTKRKDVLIRAFAEAREVVPDALLAVTIDRGDPELYDSLVSLIRELDVEEHVAVLGSIWDKLPCLYASCDVYCTPSVMEGFGMSAQEAAASRVPVVASDLVPFATEFLLGDSPVSQDVPEDAPILVGAGAIVVEADSVPGFAEALKVLLTDYRLRRRLGNGALAITVPAFGWDRLLATFLDAIAPELRGQHG